MKKILLIIFLFLISTTIVKSATLTCGVSTSLPSSAISVLKISSLTNAHGELSSSNIYTNIVYCSVDSGSLINTCNGQNTILKLSGTTNAHAESSSGTTYSTNVCLSSTVADTNIECTINPSDTAGYTCLVALSALTNAHLSDCISSGAYSNKLYCKATTQSQCTQITFYQDFDSDTYGNLTVTTQACLQPVGYVSNSNDCNDADIKINPEVNEICDNEIDDDCDEDIDCEDFLDCISDENCAVECEDIISRLECATHTTCYWSSSGTCGSCFPSPVCASLAPPECNYCSMNCLFDSAINLCTYPPCTSNSDLDTVCDETPDNCKYIKNDQVDCDGDTIGDACDPDCINGISLGECLEGDCVDCLKIDGILQIDETTGECMEIKDQLGLCEIDLHGRICESGLDCIGGYMISSSDSSKCCLIGSCGIIDVLLTGQTQYRVEESECRNPDEEGIGKKVVYKYGQAGNLIEQTEEDCTILPSETVPFYSSISILITVLVLVSFYAFRRKIFSYFNK